MTIKLEDLAPDQLSELEQQLEAKKAAAKAKKEAMIADYNAMKEKQVNETFDQLFVVSQGLADGKKQIFDQFGALLSMKKELHGLAEKDLSKQQTHTFTSSDGRRSIIIGHNVIDGWTDDVGVGVAKVGTWLDSLEAKMPDAETKQSVVYMRDLLKPDKDGILKANRILDLSKKAHELKNDALIEAVDFIRDQYRPEKTSTFVKVKYKNENDKWEWLGLSMSAV